MTARHRETHTGVRMRSGGLLAGILALCLLLLGIGAVMAGSGGRTGARHGATDTGASDGGQAFEADGQQPYRGPLPTGMVGLVTIGAQAVGTGAPRATMSAPTATPRTPAATATTFGTTPTTSDGATVAAPTSTVTSSAPVVTAFGSSTARTSAAPNPTYSWPYPYPNPWPSWPRGNGTH